MQHEFEYPLLLTNSFDQSIHAADLCARVTIEADETVSCTDWYVSDVEVYASRSGHKDKWQTLKASDPLVGKIAEHARVYHTDALNGLWVNYLRDENPKFARDVFSNDEHRTY